MAYPIEKKLVIGVSSNALFNLTAEENIFNEKGVVEFRNYHRENESEIIGKGIAYPFIKRFLDINKHYPKESPVEVVLLSKNIPEIGSRIFKSIQHYDLDISRAAFTSGKSPFEYIPAYNISLFLSTNHEDVMNAISKGFPACKFISDNLQEEDNDTDCELRVAFDFDGVIDDSSSAYEANDNLSALHEHETKNGEQEYSAGPLADFFKKFGYFQKLESKREKLDANYKKILRTSIITARNSPSHERAINTLNKWDVAVDEMFVMGGEDKTGILNVIKPHIYFDDKIVHLDDKTKIPLVHIPFGIANK